MESGKHSENVMSCALLLLLPFRPICFLPWLGLGIGWAHMASESVGLSHGPMGHHTCLMLVESQPNIRSF